MAALRFTGSYEELGKRLAGLSDQGEWQNLNENQKQFRHKDGGILNWFPSTGTIQFQGAKEPKSRLEAFVRLALSAEPESKGGFPHPPEIPLAPSPSLEKTEVPIKGPASREKINPDFLGNRFSNSELVVSFVGAVGTELKLVIDLFEDRLKAFRYQTERIRISSEIIPLIIDPGTVAFTAKTGSDEYLRISKFMDAGNEARKQAGDNSILALGVAAKIFAARPQEKDQPQPMPRRAFIIHSLKHPDEVARLREIYPEGFYLIGVHADEKRRHDHLTQGIRLTPEEAGLLMRRDEDEQLPHGQRTSDTFHLSDFFLRMDENQDRLKHSLWRILDLVFGHPYVTPTFDEYAMFMAFSAALRSADLSRQVGAVIAREKEIIATGANDCPRFGGGLYWPEYDEVSHRIEDAKDGRDYMRNEDANKVEQQRIIEDILARIGPGVADQEKLRIALEESRLADITEFGRVVHAEMEALLSLARNNVSAVNATLYGTTFPCHNCAKHIVAAGIKRVVYIEPYPKSKAAELHSDSISLGFSDDKETVHFEPFVGVGPRRFFDLFSMKLGSGYPLKRKDGAGRVVEWKPETSRARIQMVPCSYLELELMASSIFNEFRKGKGNTTHG